MRIINAWKLLCILGAGILFYSFQFADSCNLKYQVADYQCINIHGYLGLFFIMAYWFPNMILTIVNGMKIMNKKACVGRIKLNIRSTGKTIILILLCLFLISCTAEYSHKIKFKDGTIKCCREPDCYKIASCMITCSDGIKTYSNEFERIGECKD